MRTSSYLLACAAGLILALLGSEPSVVLALVAVILFPLGVALVASGAGDDRRPGSAALGPALLVGAAGSFLVVFLVRLAVAAPDWVDPLSADCGGPSTGAQQLATWFATIAFLLSTLPVLFTLAAVAGRVRRTGVLASMPLSLGLYPVAVALSGVALILASWATSC
ncbi:MAG: hypothetical protein KDB46_08570 [Solirubrobacterales bacterium]|nr:hypothetical protein [Solirubrobacterales bacterium]